MWKKKKISGFSPFTISHLFLLNNRNDKKRIFTDLKSLILINTQIQALPTTMARNQEIQPETLQPQPQPQPQLGRTTSSNTNTPVRRKNAPFLVVCRCFSLITALSAVSCIAVNILAAVRSFKNGSDVRNICSISLNYNLGFYSCLGVQFIMLFL